MLDFTLKGHSSIINSVVFSPDETLLASGAGEANFHLKVQKVAQKQRI